MKQTLILTFLALLVASFDYDQTRPTKPSVPTATPVREMQGKKVPVKKLPLQEPQAANIEFDRFDFDILSPGPHPGAFPIEGEPSKGFHYFVEAKLYGIEAIATAKFEVIDEHGALIQPAPIRRETDAGGGSLFYGVMRVPDKPFRVSLTGEGIDGKPYQRIYERLFKPIDQPPPEPLTVRMSSRAEAAKMTAWIEETMKKEAANVDAELKKSGGWIVMPRTRVFNVNYEPLLSPLGRPRGLRITYDMEFSETGYYNPELLVFPVYPNEEWRGRVEMKVLDGSIEPVPAEAGSPQVQPNLLAYGAGYIYLGHTTYHFVADMVPNYVIRNEAKTKFCLWNQQYYYQPPNAQLAYRAVLSSKEPTNYNVYISNSDFSGVIENVHGQGVWYNTFAIEGAKDCGKQPTSRF